MSAPDAETPPTVGRIVHYTSYGTPGGEYPSVCRAAIVTAVPEGGGPHLDLCVLNPTGMFFNRDVTRSETGRDGGTWHWPEPSTTPIAPTALG